jgi:predicted enzyme related to lactoylglutathione lyase
MMNDIRHFAVRADNIERAQAFYSEIFGWEFEAWGPPGFFLIQTSENPSRIQGALQQREASTTEGGDGIWAFECTIGVDNVDRVAAAVVEHGGEIIFEKATIHGVGEIIRFKDSEGNFLCAMKYFA